MIHKSKVENYNGSLKELAEDIGDLKYDALADFFKLLQEKLQRDGQKDGSRGREKLARCLLTSSESLNVAIEEIEKAWVICEPFMKDYS